MVDASELKRAVERLLNLNLNEQEIYDKLSKIGISYNEISNALDSLKGLHANHSEKMLEETSFQTIGLTLKEIMKEQTLMKKEISELRNEISSLKQTKLKKVKVKIKSKAKTKKSGKKKINKKRK